MPQKTRDVTIGEHRYQILELPTRVGCRVMMQMIPRLGGLSREEYEEFQALCWGQCRRYQNELPVPICTTKRDKDGAQQLIWQFPDLEFDTFATTRLIQEVIDTTVTPFIEARRAAAALDVESQNSTSAL